MLWCDDEIIGKQVRIKSCEAKIHGNNHACVCHLIGRIVIISRRYHATLDGKAQYYMIGYKQRVRRSEVVLLSDQRSVSK